MTEGFAGDALVPDPLVVVDRHTSFAAPPAQLWPWLVQIGKGRGGWYMPRSIERFVPPGRRGLRHVDPALQDLRVGDEHPDWGPGAPLFRLAEITPPSALVWHSLRDTRAGHGWPADPASPAVLSFSWALLPMPDAAGGTHLHVRLRMDKPAWRADPRFRFKEPLFDLFDWVTIMWLFAGLRERLASASS